MKKIISGGLVSLLVAGGLVLATAGGASAHTPTVTADCDTLHIDAVYYETKPGSGEPTITVDNPDYKPAVEEVLGEAPLITPAVEYQPAVYQIEYEFVFKKDHPNSPRWETDPNWNADGNENSKGWTATGNTRNGALLTPEVLAQDAVYGPRPVIVEGSDAVGEPTIEIPNPDYVAPDATPNRVTVIIDGVTVLETTFGTSFSQDFALAPYVAHDYKVKIRAWNDPDGSKGWSKNFAGTTTPCEIPVVPANPGASLTAVCGYAEATLTNEQAENEQNLTASFVVNVDGEFYGAYAVAGGDTEVVSFSFAEDTGSHLIEVYQAGTSEWALIASGEVPSDCIAPQPEDKVIYGEWSTPKVTCDNEAGDLIPITRTVTTTPSVLVEGQWVDGDPVITTEPGAYTVTEADVEALDCPVPPQAEKPEARILAATGALWEPYLATAVVLLALGSGFALTARRR